MQIYKYPLLLLAALTLLSACGPSSGTPGPVKIGLNLACDASKVCENELACTSDGASGNTCKKKCDPNSPTTCGTDTCSPDTDISNQSVHVCKPPAGPGTGGPGTGGPSTSKPSTSKPGTVKAGGICSKKDKCEKNLACVIQADSTYKCVETCDPNSSPTTCGTEACQNVYDVSKKNVNICLPCSPFYALATASSTISGTYYRKDAESIPDIASLPVKKSEVDGITTLDFAHPDITFIEGFLPPGAVPATDKKSARYLNLKTGEVVSITDKEAFDENTDWTIGFKGLDFYLNSGRFPGNLSIAAIHVKNETDQNAAFKHFKSFTKDSSELPTEENFKVGNEVDHTCTVQANEGAPALALKKVKGESASWIGYNRQDCHRVGAYRDVYYIIKDKDSDWMAKLFVEMTTVPSIPSAPADLKCHPNGTVYRVHYKVL